MGLVEISTLMQILDFPQKQCNNKVMEEVKKVRVEKEGAAVVVDLILSMMMHDYLVS